MSHRLAIPAILCVLGYLSALPSAEPAPITANQTISADTTLSVIGTLRARRIAVLGSQVSGRVAEVLVDVGDRVTAGQPVVRLDPVFFRLAVEAREAELANTHARLTTLAAARAAAAAQIDAAQAEAADAALNHERMRALWEKPDGSEPSIARRQFDDALTRDRAAQARVAVAKAGLDEVTARIAEANNGIALAEVALKQARQNLTESEIRAPYAGAVTRRLVDPGASATSAPVTDLMEIQETTVLFLECSIPQGYAGRISTGTALTFTIDGQPDTHQATITAVVPALDAATRTLRLRAEIDNADGHLRPGLLANVAVTLK
jgi:multidrug resistance efflux pump